MKNYSDICTDLRANPHRWLITGVAGFIGSHLLEALLKLDQEVVGIDNFSTGYQHNLDQVKRLVGENQWKKFTLIAGDVTHFSDCQSACQGIDFVLHHAALGSVPRSIEDPILANESNVTGFLKILTAARDAGVKRFVYAASSSTYGDHPGLPKVEEVIGKPLSPYAVTKYVNELYADVFFRCYGTKSIGLRYFNVFGPRQDPNGAYAAVIPQWIAALLREESLNINGDGETTRDFCYVANVVQANILACLVENEVAINQVYNIALNDSTSLNQLYLTMKEILHGVRPDLISRQPNYKEFRVGDVRYSQANIDKAKALLNYQPAYTVKQGLEIAMDWYCKNLVKNE